MLCCTGSKCSQRRSVGVEGSQQTVARAIREERIGMLDERVSGIGTRSGA